MKSIVVCLCCMMALFVGCSALVATHSGRRVDLPPSTAFEEALFTAVFEGDCEAVKELLQMGAPIDARADDNTTPLMHALMYGYCDVMVTLLREGASPAAKCDREYTALTYASHAGFAEGVDCLVAQGADIAHRAEDSYTPLHAAVCGGCHFDESRPVPGRPDGHRAVVRKLLVHGADVNAVVQDGSTPLIVAVFHRRADLVQLLLDAGADCRAVDGEGNTAHSVAARMGYDSITAIISARMAR